MRAAFVFSVLISLLAQVTLAASSDGQSPYEILDISPHATEKEIRKAYRKMMLINHPDRGGDEQRAKAINHAFDLLSDPKAKASFDLWKTNMDKAREFSGGRINPREFREAFAGRNLKLGEIASGLEKKFGDLRSRRLKPELNELVQSAKIEISKQAGRLEDYDFLPKHHFLNTDLYTLAKAHAIGRSSLSIETKEALALAVFDLLSDRRELMMNEYLYGATSGSPEGYLYGLRRDIEDEQNFVSKRTARGQLLKRLHRALSSYLQPRSESVKTRAMISTCEKPLLLPPLLSQEVE